MSEFLLAVTCLLAGVCGVLLYALGYSNGQNDTMRRKP